VCNRSFLSRACAMCQLVGTVLGLQHRVRMHFRKQVVCGAVHNCDCVLTKPFPMQSKLLGNVTIAQGGVLPNIHSVLLPKTKARTGKDGAVKQSQEF
jgi:C-terminus of histone H2A